MSVLRIHADELATEKSVTGSHTPLTTVAMLFDTATVSFTDDIPDSVRALFRCTVEDDSVLLVCSSLDDPAVQHRLNRGENLIEASATAISQAQLVMSRALDIGEWERSMTHRSLIPFMEEEVQEFIEAVGEWESSSDEESLRKELSDVLLQILFHSELAARRGAFNFDDVAAAFVAKMRTRAPYLFDSTDHIVPTEEQERLWAEGKRREAQMKLEGAGPSSDG